MGNQRTLILSFSFVTYNVLADSYIQPDWYPHTAARWLDPSIRHPALLAELVALDADIIALQEVERTVFDRLNTGLEPRGYVGRYEPKGRNKPDGCATFMRQSAVAIIQWQRLEYADGINNDPASGHLALLTIVEVNGRRLGVANTHLKYAHPETPRSEHLGARQIDELTATCEAHSCTEWIVCGDLNCTLESPVLDGLRSAGFVDAHGGLETPTCNANRDARKLDHVFITGAMESEPAPIEPIKADTPLPSSTHASDHLPVAVALRWRP
jgi:endonuclease/exonuclease/phosphatase family metal-dependent hydrolase